MSKKLLQIAKFYKKEENWLAYKDTIIQLISTEPTTCKYYLELRHAYLKLNEKNQAATTTIKYLELVTKLPFNKIKKIIQNDIKTGFRSIKTQYTPVSGANNYGALRHKHKGKYYFTKISANNSNSKKEAYFYLETIEKEKALELLAPKLHALRYINTIQYLTIDELKKLPKTQLTTELVELAQKIEKISTASINQAPTTHHSQARIKNTHHPVVIGYFYKNIHLADTHSFLLNALIEIGKKEKFPTKALKTLEQVKKIVSEAKLYTHIDPTTTYCFQHGDFKRNNLGIEYKTKKIKIFDWANYNVGPRFLDILLFSVDSSTPYNILKSIYLYNTEIAQPLSNIERIFALEAYILMNYITLAQDPTNTIVERFIRPAFKDFIKLASTYY